jgi:tetratricopeptide (TPR) repeat protein
MSEATRAPVVRCAVAVAHLAQGRREDAERECSMALAAAALESFGELLAGTQRVSEVLSREDARKILETLTASPPADEYAGQRLKLALASVMLDLAPEGSDVKAPLELADQVIAQSGDQTPERVRALLVRARALEIMNDMEGTIRAYEQVLAINDRNLQALNNLAYSLADRFHRPQEALVYAQRARESGGNSANVLDTIGWVYFLNDQADEAQSILIEALRKDPECASAQYHLGEVYRKRGRVGDARDAMRRALELASEAQDVQLSDKIRKALEQSP